MAITSLPVAQPGSTAATLPGYPITINSQAYVAPLGVAGYADPSGNAVAVSAATPMPITGGAGATFAITATALPLPAGAATSALQSSILSALGGTLVVAGVVSVSNFPATQPVSGAVTANAGTNLNTSLLALETGGNLATLAGAVTAAKVQVTVATALPAGTSIVGKFTTDQTTHGVTDLVAADITKVAGAAISQGHGTAATAIRVELPTDGTGIVGLAAGSAKIGIVTTDQTTHGTTDLVAADITKVAGAAISQGHGTAATAIRVELPTDGTGVVGLAAGEAHAGEIGGNSVNLTVSPTISASAYTSGAVLGGIQTITSAARKNGGSVTVQSLDVLDSAHQNVAIDLLFFSASPTGTWTDGSAPTWSTGDKAAYLGRVSLVTTDYTTSGGIGTGHPLFQSPVLVAGGATTSLFMVPVVQATPTYGSTTAISFRLGLLRD